MKKAFKDLHKEETYLAFAYDWKLIVHALKLLPGETCINQLPFREVWKTGPKPRATGAFLKDAMH